ncbi:hypothetical protein [Providencia sp. Je.9.19]
MYNVAFRFFFYFST